MWLNKFTFSNWMTACLFTQELVVLKNGWKTVKKKKTSMRGKYFFTVKYYQTASHIHSKPLWFVETNHIEGSPLAQCQHPWCTGVRPHKAPNTHHERNITSPEPQSISNNTHWFPTHSRVFSTSLQLCYKGLFFFCHKPHVFWPS